ncbi:MAG: hypothetical protein NXH95_10240 [Pseudomonadaceae bacterium]|nr:hypothetical protein [Pseudomonadaceae bacterium]
MVNLRAGFLLLLVLAGPSTAQTPDNFLPQPLIPDDNPLNPQKVTLGQALFSDMRLSINQTYSCASCHKPEHHFTDGLPRAINMFGEELAFNTPTLYNTAFNSSYGWTDQGLLSLEAQHSRPLFNTTPLEMGFSETAITLLQEDRNYPAHFEAAFGSTQITTEKVIKALASYVRTIRSPVSAFDDMLFNDNRDALSADARAGMDLFFSEALGCSTCHASLTFSGPISHAEVRTEPAFHVTGVGDSTTAFRAPTLRAVAHTGPYMHDGSLQSLEQVLDHYQNSEMDNVPEFSLTIKQKRQVVEFLKSL